MFTFVPQGYDAYIMKHIIHDWPDEACLKILRGEVQFRDLFAAAGWRMTRIIPTPAGVAIVEGVPA